MPSVENVPPLLLWASFARIIRGEVLALKQRDFFALPFPNDLRRTSTGLDLTGFPNPMRSQLLSD